MMKNPKIWIALIALVVVVGLMAGLYFVTRQQPEDTGNNTTAAANNTGTDGSDSTDATYAKTFTLIVVHADGSEKAFTIGTNQDYLSQALLDEGLIVESGSAGMYNTVHGETADWNTDQSYWAFYVGEDYAMEGMDTTVITDGTVYKLVYTIGW